MTTTAPATRVDVRKARPGDRAAVCAALAAAFHDDPVFAWIHPDPGDRAAKVRFLFDLVVGRHRAAGAGRLAAGAVFHGTADSVVHERPVAAPADVEDGVDQPRPGAYRNARADAGDAPAEACRGAAENLGTLQRNGGGIEVGLAPRAADPTPAACRRARGVLVRGRR